VSQAGYGAEPELSSKFLTEAGAQFKIFDWSRSYGHLGGSSCSGSLPRFQQFCQTNLRVLFI